MAAPNISEILTSTIENRTGKLADSVTDNNALLYKLKKGGRAKPASGGVTIRQEIMYRENGNGLWYSGSDPLNTSAQEVISSADFDWKQYATAVTINGLEQLQNSGKEKILDLLEARVENAEISMTNAIAAGVYADGTGSGGKEMGGLQLLVAASPATGTVGGINRATAGNEFWRNYARDSSTNSVTLSSTTVQSEFNIMFLNTARGKDTVDLIVCDNTVYRYYLESLQTIQRVTSTEMAEAGFTNLKYMNADVVFDGGIGGNMPANSAYFLNTKYIHYRPHSDRNMVLIGGDRMNTNQDAIVKLMGWAGNMTLSGAMFQGQLQA